MLFNKWQIQVHRYYLATSIISIKLARSFQGCVEVTFFTVGQKTFTRKINFFSSNFQNVRWWGHFISFRILKINLICIGIHFCWHYFLNFCSIVSSHLRSSEVWNFKPWQIWRVMKLINVLLMYVYTDISRIQIVHK